MTASQPAEAEHSCLGKRVQGTPCKIPNAQKITPHKVRYIWNAAIQDEDGGGFAFTREVKIVNEAAA
jgi:hypothetical protein